MGTLIFGLVAAAAARVITAGWSRSLPKVAPLRRTNYRGLTVPTACGMVVLAGSAAGLAIFSTVEQMVGHPESGFEGLRMLAALLGFGFLGLWDDIAGGDAARGWRGHLSSLRSGAPSSGAIKLVGGVALGAVLAASGPDRGRLAIVVGAGVVAGSANLFNLLDLRPARAGKFWLVGAAAAAAGLALIGQGGSAMGLVVVASSVLAFMPHELAERAMYGDVGANAIGGVLGAALLSAGSQAQLGVLGFLVLLTILGDKPGLSRVIERIAPLRAFDRIGRAGR